MKVSVDKLRMSFDPRTIEHLGVKMYSVLPNAIAELIANSYDADATRVDIKLYEDGENRRICVIDNGNGMSFEEINEKFLRIGRKRREEDQGISSSLRRRVTGKKGLGKLAFFGIGDEIKITTYKAGVCVSFTMNWSELINSKNAEYEPKFSILKCPVEKKGTIVEVGKLKRRSNFDVNQLAISLSKLFNLFDRTFRVYLSLNDSKPTQVDQKLKFQNLARQFVWHIPNDVNNEYLIDNGINGEIISTEKPLAPGLRGITLYAKGRLVNLPEFFGASESSHAYSYLTGWLNVDFVDDYCEDVISTDRQSLNWEEPVVADLRRHLKTLVQQIEKAWREKRREHRVKIASDKSQINFNRWYGTLSPKTESKVRAVVDTVVDSSELEKSSQTRILTKLHQLIPEYAEFDWRHLHPKVKEKAEEYYRNKDYYHATEEVVKCFLAEVRKKVNDFSIGNIADRGLVQRAFGPDGLLSVTGPFKKKNGDDFSEKSKENIETGQRLLSEGVVAGVRNVLAHEEVEELMHSGLFRQEDCLNMLSLLSHLFKRLDDSILVEEK